MESEGGGLGSELIGDRVHSPLPWLQVSCRPVRNFALYEKLQLELHGRGCTDGWPQLTQALVKELSRLRNRRWPLSLLQKRAGGLRKGGWTSECYLPQLTARSSSLSPLVPSYFPFPQLCPGTQGAELEALLQGL